MRLEIGADDAPAAPLREGHPKLEDTGTLNNKNNNCLNPKYGKTLNPLKTWEKLLNRRRIKKLPFFGILGHTFPRE